MIYITEFNNIKKANEYIKEAAFGEYPYGQNNYALLNEFYFNNMEEAEYMYSKSSKKHFALAEYNLGHMKEKEGKLKESIEFYINASNDEYQNLVFLGKIHNDKRLKISIKFVICFTNLKLTKYYFLNGNYDESKKYFIKAFTKLKMNDEKSSYKFRFYFSFHQNKLFSYLKAFILKFPEFNLLNQPNIDIKLKDKILNEIKTENKLRIDVQNDKLISQKNASNINETFFENPVILFDAVMKNEYLKDIFICEIQDILDLMNEVSYTPPYSILFGRIYIGKPKTKNICPKNIDKSFYEGFGYDLLLIIKPSNRRNLEK